MYLLLLGSNLGNRKQQITDGILSIKHEIGPVVKSSSFYETEPWGLTDQPAFLNVAIEVDSSIPPLDMLQKCRKIELAAGLKPSVHWGPRYLDIDILYHDGEIVSETELVIPHPKIAQRNFALVPLMEIAGDFTDPVSNLSIEELYDQCEDTSEVFLYEE